MGLTYRLAGAEKYPLFQTPQGMNQGMPQFGAEDIGKRIDLVLRPAADPSAQLHGAVDILATGLYLTGVNGTAFTVSNQAPRNGSSSPLRASSPSRPMDILYEHVRAYAVR